MIPIVASGSGLKGCLHVLEATSPDFSSSESSHAAMQFIALLPRLGHFIDKLWVPVCTCDNSRPQTTGLNDISSDNSPPTVSAQFSFVHGLPDVASPSKGALAKVPCLGLSLVVTAALPLAPGCRASNDRIGRDGHYALASKEHCQSSQNRTFLDQTEAS